MLNIIKEKKISDKIWGKYDWLLTSFLQRRFLGLFNFNNCNNIIFRFIHSINRANLGFTLDVNHHADKTDAEMKALRGKQFSNHGPNGGLPFTYDIEKELSSIPESLDWRLYGAVTPVKGNYQKVINFFSFWFRS